VRSAAPVLLSIATAMIVGAATVSAGNRPLRGRA
jgi:hypothetical protein